MADSMYLHHAGRGRAAFALALVSASALAFVPACVPHGAGADPAADTRTVAARGGGPAPAADGYLPRGARAMNARLLAATVPRQPAAVLPLAAVA